MSIRIVLVLLLLPFLSRAQHPDTLSFSLTEFNNILVDAVLNQGDSLRLKFDSGTTGLLLTHEAIAEKTSLMDGLSDKTTYDYQPLEKLSALNLGRWQWDSLEVFPVSLSGQGSDGRFGWDLFRTSILEIDYDASLLIVHDRLPERAMLYSKFQLVPVESLFGIRGDLHFAGSSYSSSFLFDTGYQKALLLDSTLLIDPAFPDSLPVLKTTVLLNGAGERFVTKVIQCDKLVFDEVELRIDSIPAQLLHSRNPAGFAIHILGNELLCRMNVIFDFPSGKLYFQPNGYFNRPYNY